jgi:hypothetical protein
MFTKTIENTSPKRQRVNESQSVHSLAIRACKGAEHGTVQLGNDSMKVLGLRSAASANSISGQKNGRIFGENKG